GGDIADGNADPARTFRRAGDAGKARLALHQHVVGFHFRVRPILAVARNIDGNEPRIGGAQRLAIQPVAPDRAGSKVLDENIRLRDHVFEKGEIVRLLDIELDRFLAPVQPDEIAALAVDNAVIGAREVTVRAFNLDDARARIGKTAGKIG